MPADLVKAELNWISKCLTHAAALFREPSQGFAVLSEPLSHMHAVAAVQYMLSTWITLHSQFGFYHMCLIRTFCLRVPCSQTLPSQV